MPTFYGEKVEMRLLESSQKPLSLEELGMSPEVAKIVSDNLKKSYGMLISCGPTGSGKTTTLYALMNMLNRPEVNMTTVEDPIEYNMRYVNQTQINPQAGVTFASGLRALSGRTRTSSWSVKSATPKRPTSRCRRRSPAICFCLRSTRTTRRRRSRAFSI